MIGLAAVLLSGPWVTLGSQTDKKRHACWTQKTVGSNRIYLGPARKDLGRRFCGANTQTQKPRLMLPDVVRADDVENVIQIRHLDDHRQTAAALQVGLG